MLRISHRNLPPTGRAPQAVAAIYEVAFVGGEVMSASSLEHVLVVSAEHVANPGSGAQCARHRGFAHRDRLRGGKNGIEIRGADECDAAAIGDDEVAVLNLDVADGDGDAGRLLDDPAARRTSRD